MGAKPMDLLWQHTVFPYATAFFEPGTFENATRAALSTGSSATGMGAVTQSVSDHIRFRRFCPACIIEDKKRWGESYWRRSHNLPGVLVCLVHNRVLTQTQLRTAGRLSWSYALPHELQGSPVLRQRPSTFEVELARCSIATLGRAQPGQPGTLQAARPASWYRAALQELGLLSTNRQVSVQKLAAWAQSAIGGKLTRFGFAEKYTSLAWLGLMVRPKISIPFVPLKHLVFETLLALERTAVVASAVDNAVAVNELPATAAGSAGPRSPVETAVGVTLRKLDHVPSGMSGPPIHLLEARDKQYAAAVLNVIRDYKNRGERARVNDALTEAGCWSEYRHDRTNFPRVSAVVSRLRMSTVSAKQVKG
jgi:hypothetical protein